MIKDLVGRALEVEMDEASSGKEAAQLLSSRNYGAVISDMHMPNGDGAWLLRFLREHRMKTPLIIFSSEVRKVIPPVDDLLIAIVEKSEFAELIERLRMVGMPCRN